MNDSTRIGAISASPSVRNRETVGVWLVALGAALWGTDAVLRLPLIEQFSAAEIVFLEHVVLVLFALPVCWMNRHQFARLTVKEWAALLFISWGGSGIATLLFTAAFQYGHPSVVLLLQKFQPLIVLSAASLFLGERLPRGYYVALTVALCGAYLLTFGFALPFFEVSASKWIGSLLAIGAAVFWGGSTVFGRFLLDGMSFTTLTAARFLFALPFTAAIAAGNGADLVQTIAQGFFSPAIVPLFLLAVFPGLVSLLLYYRGLSATKASYATLAELAFPATGVLLNWVMFEEFLTIGQVTGFALIWVVVYYLSRAGEREAGGMGGSLARGVGG